MADGTIKQINPFTDNEVWSVQGRAAKPVQNETPQQEPAPISPEDFTAYCSFCVDRLFETPPEKSRLVQNADGTYARLDHVRPSEMKELSWLFRRVPNLFEIVTVDYWKKNYNYFL